MHGGKRMNELKELLEAMLPSVILAAFGGVARACRFGVKSWRQFIGSIIVSAFTGVVVHLMLKETGVTQSMQAAFVAASGYSGGAILDAVVSVVAKRLESLSNQK